jgi:hypothetical protein
MAAPRPWRWPRPSSATCAAARSPDRGQARRQEPESTTRPGRKGGLRRTGPSTSIRRSRSDRQ